MAHRVCPWWLGYFLASPVRRWLGQNPDEILSPYIRQGMTVLEPGPGMGFFTIPLAHRVGPSGRVIAVDVQPKMIAGLKRRAAKADMLDRIDARVTSADSMGIADLEGKVDFTFAFAMVHEVPDATRFFGEAARATKPGGQMLLAEPRGQVDEENLSAELSAAEAAGFSIANRPEIATSISAFLVRR